MKWCNRLALLSFMLSGGFIAGCSNEPSAESEHTPETQAVVTFNAKNGLSVPPGTARYIGLRIADVEERKIAAIFQFSAQVYGAAGQSQVTSIQAHPTALASGNVNAAEAAKLSEGQPVSVQSFSGASFPGRILALNRDLEKASAQVEVLLAISDAPGQLDPGAFVTASVPLGGEKTVVSVPRSALLHTSQGDFVYTVSGNHFVRAEVKLGATNQEFAEISEGLYSGDQIVVQPVMTLWMAELQFLRGGKACADGH